MDGIINVNKPKDMTSFDVVAIVRRACCTKRVGHLGTLDPMAEGVLPVTIGRAGRVMDYLDTDIKVYRGSARLGLETDTLDIWGNTVKTCEDFSIDRKMRGKKLYEYAREGKAIDVKSRKAYIEKADIISFDGCEFEFEIACSKGTYIRSICSDIGRALGCGAAMSSLTRIRSGCFDIADAIDIEKIRNMSPEEIGKMLTPIDKPLEHFGLAELEDWEKHLFVNGVELREDQWSLLKKPKFSEEKFPLTLKDDFARLYRVYGKAGEFLGTAKENNGLIKADKVFYNANI